jgi:hypothetical protein
MLAPWVFLWGGVFLVADAGGGPALSRWAVTATFQQLRVRPGCWASLLPLHPLSDTLTTGHWPQRAFE